MAEKKIVTVRIFPDRVAKVAQTRSGPIGRFTQKVAGEVRDEAKALLDGRRYSRHHAGRSMANSLSIAPISPPPSWAVTVSHPAALAVHQGSTSHVIIGHKSALLRRGPAPVDREGSSVFGPVFAGPDQEAPMVSHPGTKAFPFLVQAARAKGLRVNTGRGRSNFANREAFSATASASLIRRSF